MALLVLIAVLLCAVLVRVGMLQTLDSRQYALAGTQQRIGPKLVLPAARGTVFDRSMVELAVSVPQPTVWVDPGVLKDEPGKPSRQGERDEVVSVLTSTLALNATSSAKLAKELVTPGLRFAYVSRQIDDTTANSLRKVLADRKLAGVYVSSEPRRFLPGRDLAQGLLGSTDLDGKGSSGLEQRYDAVLTGTAGELIRERDADGRTIPGGFQDEVAPQPGDDLVLTIDQTLQYAAEDLVRKAVIASKSKAGWAVIMNPRTGDVLAMANIRATEAPGGTEVSKANNAVIDVFEPGSVNKLITIAAAVNEGLVSPSTIFQVPYSIKVGDAEFTDHDQHGVQPMTMTDIVAKSSNVGTISVAKLLGAAKVDQYLRSFGLGTKTALDLPYESAGLLAPLKRWSQSSLGAFPIGQGIAVTAVQMLSAFNVIANGGAYQPPRLVRSTIDRSGTVHDVPIAASRPVVTPATAQAMNAMLQEVVKSGEGTGGKAAVEGYTVAGKTGTAYKPQPNGTYLDSSGNYRYFVTFAGFVPAEDPQLSILVSLDEPQGDHYAGQVAAPLFADLAKVALRRMEIPPTAR